LPASACFTPSASTHHASQLCCCRPSCHLQDLITCERSGRDLAVQVKRKTKAKEKSSILSMAAASAASGAQLAMGRVVGSLAVVTARDEDATTALLASWITQVCGECVGSVWGVWVGSVCVG
jgi:hypothetical protein